LPLKSSVSLALKPSGFYEAVAGDGADTVARFAHCDIASAKHPEIFRRELALFAVFDVPHR
jgi:hypothetical protein